MAGGAASASVTQQGFPIAKAQRARFRLSWVGAAGILLLAASPLRGIAEPIVDGKPAAGPSRAPRWDARGLGPLPWQGIACLDASDDGRFIAVGTIAPPGDPNLFLLDESGRVVGQHRAGRRWVGEVVVSDDGRFVAGLSTTPEGTAGDTPRLYGFTQGTELAQISDRFRLRDFRPGACMFHYGDHSNHVPRVTCWAGRRWVVAGDDQVWWLSPADSTPAQQVHLGQGMTTAFAAGASGLAVVGRLSGEMAVHGPECSRHTPCAVRSREESSGRHTECACYNLLVLKSGTPKPVWSRAISADVDSSPEPEKGVYGPPAPPYEDVKFQAPLAVAADPAGQRIAVADYQGWRRWFRPRDGSAAVPFGIRFMPSRPTIHVYDAEGKTIRRVGPEAFSEAFWCDLILSSDGRKLLIWPHNWTSRGLGGVPLLPAHQTARSLYVLDIAGGGLHAVRFPDAISSVHAGGSRIAVGCWDRKVYLLDPGNPSIRGLSDGLDVGAASLVYVSADGKRIAVATVAGVVRMFDADGKELWQTDLAKAAEPGDKPWTRKQKADALAPGVWRTNGGLAHSDLGSQIVIEAPRGLILIDPNAGASFEQNWARIQGAGLDPMQVKYVLVTHEHGDHAPGAYLWRVVTGAQVVASAETAYILRHHIPGGAGYGLHPPVPVDMILTEDAELDLAGLKVKAMRLPGHTSGSMGYAFEKEGRTYAATGDLIMPGGVLGYSGSLDFSADDVLRSLRKLAALGPDVVLGGHGGGDPDDFIAKGIAAGEATGWSKTTPERPNPLYGFGQTDYLVAAWLEPILSADYGDVDGDRRPDVAVLVPKGNGSAVKVYLNQGGKFQKSPDAEIDLPDLGRGWKLRMVRLGESGATGFFVSSESQALLLRPQGGRLRFKVAPIEVTRGSQVVAGDFNGDGRPDLLIGSRFVQGYSIACGREDGGFDVRHTKAPSQTYFDIQWADVNGDRREDLITSCGDIFLRQPGGSPAETPAFHLTPPSGEPAGWAFMAAADFSKDGRTDVAMVAAAKDGAAVWLYRNTANATAPFPAEPSEKFVVPGVDVCRDGPTVADWNGDGTADLILHVRDKPPGACVLAGSASDGLDPRRAVSITLDYTPHFDTRFGVADFNGDGRADLAGFGPSAVGATGVYIRLQPAGK